MLGLVLALQLAAVSPAQQNVFDAGMKRFRDADFEGAIVSFQQLAKDASTDRGLAARSWLWLGLAHFDLGRTDDAHDAFVNALAIDSTLDLPDEAPPSALGMFTKLRTDAQKNAQLQKDLAQLRKLEAEGNRRENEPPTAKKDVPAAELAPDLRETREAPSEPGRGLPVWAPQAAGGAAAACGVAAIIFKLASNGNFDSAAAETRAAQAKHLNTRAGAQQHFAEGFGLAAIGLAVGAGVLYVLEQQ